MNKAISRILNIPIETRGVLKPRGYVNDAGVQSWSNLENSHAKTW